MPYDPDHQYFYGASNQQGEALSTAQVYHQTFDQDVQVQGPNLGSSSMENGMLPGSTYYGPQAHPPQHVPRPQSWQPVPGTFPMYQQQQFTSPHLQQHVYQPPPVSSDPSGLQFAQPQAQNHHAYWQQQRGQPPAPYQEVEQPARQLPIGQSHVPRQLQQHRPQQRMLSQQHHSQPSPGEWDSAFVNPSNMSKQPQRSNRPAEQPISGLYLPQMAKPSAQSQSSNAQAPQMPSRVMTRVEIPIQRGPDVAILQSYDTNLPKRRRSNDGHAISVDHSRPSPGLAVPVPPREPPPVASSPLSELRSSQALPPPSTPRPDVDYHAVLLALSDEYVDAAHAMASSLCTSGSTEQDFDQYHRLMAAGIGCLKSVLKNFRQSDPRKEARIRLRLASLLHEETEDAEEAEEILGKGIALCERSRLVDLKYAMQHLLTRLLASSNPKAAIKSVEKLIAEVETLKLIPWVYAFRFLRISVGMQMSVGTDSAAVLRHLSAVISLAQSNRHTAVSIVAEITEAVVHLRVETLDSVDLAQRSISVVRTHQLSPEMAQLPQIRVLLGCLDLGCQMISCSPEQISKKMQQMQVDLEPASKVTGWTVDGSFYVPLPVQASKNIAADTMGVMTQVDDGSLALAFTWLSKSEMFTLGYALSGIASMPKNCDTLKAEVYLKEALKINKARTGALKTSLTCSQTMLETKQAVNATIEMLMAFALAGRDKLENAEKIIQRLEVEIANAHIQPSAFQKTAIRYLSAVCHQGRGRLQKALGIYEIEVGALESKAKSSPALKDIRVLAALNSIHIVRALSDDGVLRAATLLNSVEAHCLAHPNKSFTAAYHIVKATMAPADTPVIQTKTDLNTALISAQAVRNKQQLSVIMNIMTRMFFTDIVGDQAIKSANAGRTLAKQTGDGIWVAVANGMYRDTLERRGQLVEAVQADREAREAVAGLPQDVLDRLCLAS